MGKKSFMTLAPGVPIFHSTASPDILTPNTIPVNLHSFGSAVTPSAVVFHPGNNVIKLFAAVNLSMFVISWRVYPS